ncbi:hypothetical protein Hamer_G014979, partial [Homarus americanus]
TPGQENTFWGVTQLLHGVETKTLCEGSLNLSYVYGWVERVPNVHHNVRPQHLMSTSKARNFPWVVKPTFQRHKNGCRPPVITMSSSRSSMIRTGRPNLHKSTHGSWPIEHQLTWEVPGTEDSLYALHFKSFRLINVEDFGMRTSREDHGSIKLVREGGHVIHIHCFPGSLLQSGGMCYGPPYGIHRALSWRNLLNL